jgi:hypothetical protein
MFSHQPVIGRSALSSDTAPRDKSRQCSMVIVLLALCATLAAHEGGRGPSPDSRGNVVATASGASAGQQRDLPLSNLLP